MNFIWIRPLAQIIADYAKIIYPESILPVPQYPLSSSIRYCSRIVGWFNGPIYVETGRIMINERWLSVPGMHGTDTVVCDGRYIYTAANGSTLKMDMDGKVIIETQVCCGWVRSLLTTRYLFVARHNRMIMIINPHTMQKIIEIPGESMCAYDNIIAIHHDCYITEYDALTTDRIRTIDLGLSVLRIMYSQGHYFAASTNGAHYLLIFDYDGAMIKELDMLEGSSVQYLHNSNNQLIICTPWKVLVLTL